MLFKTKRISRTGLDFIKDYEKLRLKRYRDLAGKWTIGWGHLIKPGENYTVITRQKADELLASDLKNAETTVNSLVTVPLTPGQFDSLVSLVYNIGSGNFKISTLLKRINEYDYQSALAQFPVWNKVRNEYNNLVVSDGLSNRRAGEQELFIA